MPSSLTPTTTISTTAPVTTTLPTTTLPPVTAPARSVPGTKAATEHPAVAKPVPPKSSSKRPITETASKKTKAVAAEPLAKGPSAFLILDVEPAGRIYVDGKMVGSTPPLTRVPVTPGRHRVEIHGSLPPGIYYYRVNLGPGESQPLSARFEPYN